MAGFLTSEIRARHIVEEHNKNMTINTETI